MSKWPPHFHPPTLTSSSDILSQLMPAQSASKNCPPHLRNPATNGHFSKPFKTIHALIWYIQASKQSSFHSRSCCDHMLVCQTPNIIHMRDPTGGWQKKKSTRAFLSLWEVSFSALKQYWGEIFRMKLCVRHSHLALRHFRPSSPAFAKVNSNFTNRTALPGQN